MTVLVDTAAFYALADSSDAHHEAAVDYYQGVAGSSSLVTTDYVMIETWSLIRKRLGRASAMHFWDRLSAGLIPLLGVSGADLERARQLAHARSALSLVDATTMAIMERLQIAAVFTFDTHFDTPPFQRVPD